MFRIFSRALALLATSLSVAHAASPAIPPLSPLHTENGRIVAEDGSAVSLRGVNLGGWLVEEIWMLPIENMPPDGSGFGQITCHASLWGAFEKRFGQADMLRIRRAWRDTWITKADFERIKAAGMNSVRLPFYTIPSAILTGCFPGSTKLWNGPVRWEFMLSLICMERPGARAESTIPG